MAAIDDQLEGLFAKLRTLPRERQELAVEALAEIVAGEVYVLSDDERAALEPALERAKRGGFASQAEVDEALNETWS